MGLKALRGAAAVWAVIIASPATASGFGSDTVHVYYNNPTQASVYLDLGTFVIPGSVGACFAYCPELSVMVTGNEITVANDSGYSLLFDPHPFNGFTVQDISRNLRISGVTLDSATTAPVSIGDASWTSGSVSLNFQGQTWGIAQQGVFDVQFSTVPELPTWAMALAGFAGLGVAGFRRGRRVNFAGYSKATRRCPATLAY